MESHINTRETKYSHLIPHLKNYVKLTIEIYDISVCEIYFKDFGFKVNDTINVQKDKLGATKYLTDLAHRNRTKYIICVYCGIMAFTKSICVRIILSLCMFQFYDGITAKFTCLLKYSLHQRYGKV